MEKYKNLYLIFALISFIIIVLYAFFTYRFVHIPLGRLVKAFRKVENGDLSIAIDHHPANEFRYLFMRFNAMVENLKILVEQVYKQKILTQKAELKQLQAQINPHFLYNSFFILHRMVKDGDQNAVVFSKQIGNYLKFVTRSAEDDVTLISEIQHARIYSDIQAMRFSNRIKVNFDELPGEYENFIVPKLILQPLIENVFEHGLKGKVTNGIVNIYFNFLGKGFFIILEDNGDELSDIQLEKLQKLINDQNEDIENTAIININKRIKYKFGEESGLDITRSKLGGLMVVIKFVIQGESSNV